MTKLQQFLDDKEKNILKSIESRAIPIWGKTPSLFEDKQTHVFTEQKASDDCIKYFPFNERHG